MAFKLPQFTFTSVLATILMGMAMIQIVSYLLVSLGWVKNGVKLGVPFLLLEVVAVMAAMYIIVIKKQLTLDNRDIFGLVLLIAFVVASFVFLPQLLPDIFDPTQIVNWHTLTFSALGMPP